MKDLTKGSPSKVMISFAIPVALGNIFQLCYSLADTRVVGSTLGEAALAAVGATTSISTLFIGFLSGLTNGFALLIARQFGAGDKKGVTRYGAGCLLLGCITSVLLTFICVSSLPFILRLLNVPEALMGQSTAYIRAVLLGLLATMLYNGCASILRAVGDTTAPLLFLLFAAALNVALDLLFILKFGFGVAGAAWATVLSQSLSAIISLVYMFKRTAGNKSFIYLRPFHGSHDVSGVFRNLIPSMCHQYLWSGYYRCTHSRPQDHGIFHASILCYGRYHGNILRAEYGSRT